MYSPGNYWSVNEEREGSSPHSALLCLTDSHVMKNQRSTLDKSPVPVSVSCLKFKNHWKKTVSWSPFTNSCSGVKIQQGWLERTVHDGDTWNQLQPQLYKWEMNILFILQLISFPWWAQLTYLNYVQQDSIFKLARKLIASCFPSKYNSKCFVVASGQRGVLTPASQKIY